MQRGLFRHRLSPATAATSEEPESTQQEAGRTGLRNHGEDQIIPAIRAVRKRESRPETEEIALHKTSELTSNVGATAEIAGDAALLVDPYDTRSIRDGLIALCRDAELANDLVAKGGGRVADFSSERHAQRLLPVYQSAVGRRRKP